MALDGEIFSVSLHIQAFEEKHGGMLPARTEWGICVDDENAVKGREEGYREFLGKLGEEVAQGPTAAGQRLECCSTHTA